MPLLDLVAPPRDRMQPLGPTAAVAPALLLLVLLLARPSRTLNMTLLPLFCLSALLTSIRYTTGSTPDDYGRASLQFTLVLRAIDAFLLTQPSFELACTRINEQRVPPAWTLRRLGWAAKFATTMRGAGWNWNVVAKDPSPAPTNTISRREYLRRRVGKLILTYLALDVASSYMQSRPYFHRVVPLSNLSRAESVLNMLAACASAALAMNTAYQVLCVICVGSCIWRPDECVDLFGSLASASTLAGFWGRTWHQSFRRPFTSIASFLAESLLGEHRPPSPRPSSPSLVRSTMITCFAFALSGLLHAFSSFAMARTGSGSLKFFTVQPLGILLEACVARFARNWNRTGSRVVKRCVGYAWTASWLLYWCPNFFDELVQAGFWEVDPAPLSVVRGLWKGEWLHL